MTAAPKPVVLMILDGFGYSESPESNAIMAANTPVWDRLWASAPRTLISGSGMDVGLPDGQMGNSEVRSEERRVGKECRSRWSPYH